MSFIEDAKAAVTRAIPGPGTPDEQRKALDVMPITELAALWCSLQYFGIRDYTDEAWAAFLYFDHLPHDAPERAFELVLTVLRSEAHKRVKMELNDKTMLVLVGHEQIVSQIEQEAPGNPQLRWLLGGCYSWGADESLKARLAAFADEDAWRADADARDTPEHAIDFAALSVPELARAWLEQKCKPHKDQDDNWMALCDYERDLQDEDPDRLIDLIVEIQHIETNPRVLSFLAAGPLEDVISEKSIARIEREAAANPAFRELLGGVWYHRQPEPIKNRLDAIVDGKHW